MANNNQMTSVLDFQNLDIKDSFNAHVLNDPFGFIQQTTYWSDIVTPIKGDEPAFFFIENDEYSMSASLYLFKSELGNILVSNIQAGSLGTFSYRGDQSKEDSAYSKIIDQIIACGDENNCVLVTLTSNPLKNDADVIIKHLKPQAGMNTFIQIIDIQSYFDSDGNIIYKDYVRRSNLSRNVSNSYKSDLKFQVSQDFKDLENWYELIHKKRLQELGGKPLPLELFENIFKSDDFKRYFKFFTVMLGDKMVGGDLCIFSSNGVLDNFMMSTDGDYFEKGINFFMVDNILRWCYSNGIRIYNWQSSNPPVGGIFRFKKQWGSDIMPYSYFTRILDENRFKELRKNDINVTMSEYQGHFVAPYKTLISGEFDFFDKVDINKSAGIYESELSKPSK